jgi:hypothetical protein
VWSIGGDCSAPRLPGSAVNTSDSVPDERSLGSDSFVARIQHRMRAW